MSLSLRMRLAEVWPEWHINHSSGSDGQEAIRLVASELEPRRALKSNSPSESERSEWQMPDLHFLAARLGKWEPIQDAQRRLIKGAAQGLIRTCNLNGEQIHSAKWRSWHRLNSDSRLKLAQMDAQGHIENEVVPLFNRDDVIALIKAANTASAKVGQPLSSRVTDDQIANYLIELRDQRINERQRHGRDELVRNAAQALGVPGDRVRRLWDERRLGKAPRPAKPK